MAVVAGSDPKGNAIAGAPQTARSPVQNVATQDGELRLVS